MKILFLILFLLLIGFVCYQCSKRISLDWVVRVTQTGIRIAFIAIWIIIAIVATLLVL
jgi:hypothetical protein